MAMQLAMQQQQQQQLAAQQTEMVGAPEGQGFNPALEGSAPIEAVPGGATFEGATGESRAGEELPFDLGGAG